MVQELSMRRKKQLFLHLPEEGIYGDCHRTAIACLLNLDPEDVPHFGAIHTEDSVAFNKAFEDWLIGRGFRTVSVVYSNGPLEEILKSIDGINPGAYFLFGGQSATGVNHTVICCHGRIEWDPSINNAGIVGPCTDGYYWATHLVPAFMYDSE
jgi:hypothetical protein